MSGYSLTTAATLMCPHGGTVKIISANTTTKAGAFIALATDQFIVSGCTYQLPGPVPSPCLTVQWDTTDKKVTAKGNATLSKSCSGTCLSGTQAKQGAVLIMSTQTKVKSK